MERPLKSEDFVYLNLDIPYINREPATELLALSREYGIGVKVGTVLNAHQSWVETLRRVDRYGLKVFADTKSHDIANTTEHSLRAIFAYHPELINIYASAPTESLIRFLEVRQEMQSLALSQGRGSLAIAVTELTSKTDQEIREEYNGRTRKQQVRWFAHKAIDLGFDGVTCSGDELKMLTRERKTKEIAKVVLGVRPKWAEVNDQAYTITPGEAVRLGATAIGVGRPITNPPDQIGSPRNAIERILEEIDQVIN